MVLWMWIQGGVAANHETHAAIDAHQLPLLLLQVRFMIAVDEVHSALLQQQQQLLFLRQMTGAQRAMAAPAHCGWGRSGRQPKVRLLLLQACPDDVGEVALIGRRQPEEVTHDI